MMNEDKIVVFETFSDPIQANIVKGLLDSYEIECFLADENMVNLNAMYSSAVGGVKLNVFEKDIERIRTILQSENIETVRESDSESDTEKIVCTNCQSRNVAYGASVTKKFGFSTALIFSLITSFLLMVYPFRARKMYHCFDCGHEFKKA